MYAQTILNEATDIRNILTKDRRMLHQNPEVGMTLSKTMSYIRQQLAAMGYDPIDLGSGVVAEIGKPNGKSVLLRADADALPIAEKTGLSFAAQNGCMHACGHDMHAAMLLGAARLLKKHEDELGCRVRIVFQPDEEGFRGAKSMLESGVLENPTPSCALALHVHSGTPTGYILCGHERFMAGCTVFRINVRGTGCHGAMPETGVDPLFAVNRIYIGLHEIVSREVSPKVPLSLTVGKMGGGDAPNVIPDKAVIEGTIRCFDDTLCETVVERIRAIAELTAKSCRADAQTEILSSVPCLYNDPHVLHFAKDCAEELFGEKSTADIFEGGMGSEDFAVYTKKIPCAYLLIGAGSASENASYGKPMHNEKVVFNEDILPRGAALYAYFALRASKENENGVIEKE